MFRSHRIFAVSFHHRRRLFHKKAVANSKVPHVVIIRGIIRGYDSHLAIPTLDDSVEFYTTYCSFLPTIRHFSHLLPHQPVLASEASTSQHMGIVRFFRLLRIRAISPAREIRKHVLFRKSDSNLRPQE